jgi:hypothetical protein
VRAVCADAIAGATHVTPTTATMTSDSRAVMMTLR